MAKASGERGVVTFGPIPAATLHAWSMTREQGETRGNWHLTAKATNVDSYYITQSPLTVSLQMGSRKWRWKDVALEIDGQNTARGVLVGRPEIV